MKRETIIVLKEMGRLQTGKAVNYEWAFWAASRLAQARLIDLNGIAIDEEQDEHRLVKLYNYAVAALRVTQNRVETQARHEAKERASRSSPAGGGDDIPF